MKKLILTLCAVLLTMMSFAQYSFISNGNYGLNFYKAYLDIPLVKKASLANGKISNEMLGYIFKNSNPADVKYAILNALGYDGKMAENSEINSQTIESFLSNNYESGMSFNSILEVFGSSTAMCIALIDAYSDPLQAEQSLEYAKKVCDKNEKNGICIQSDYLMWKLIAVEYSMMWVGDGTPMGTQDGFQDAIKSIIGICKSDVDELRQDMRKSALDIIIHCFEDYVMAVGKIRIVNKSSNPYQLSLNGDVIYTLSGGHTLTKEVDPGYYHIKAVQVSGYMFSPTVNNRDVNVEDGETKTVTIGYED